MLIILEGPDGGGKTMLAAELRQRIDAYLWLLRTNSRSHHRRDMVAIAEWMKEVPRHLALVCDRHPFISEEVYGPIIRHTPSPFITDSPVRLRELTDYLADVMVIYCRPPVDTIKESSRKEAQMAGVAEHLKQLISAYDSLMLALGARDVRVVRYDWSRDGEQNRIVSLVDKFIKERT